MAQTHTTPFEKNNNQTANYDEAIAFYKSLADSSPLVTMVEEGMTDSGKPLHTVVISKDLKIPENEARRDIRATLLINNAIHAGEPCGVDASMMLARELATTHQHLLDRAKVVIIPFYNIGGVLNRNSHTRANQNGPESYGFRGNARNYDLNRDFIKCDTENARSFAKIFQKWKPHVFIDNHTSNGADYQYTLTLIPTQSDKLAAPMAKYMDEVLLPDLYAKMAKTDYEMTPYVYARSTPDEGIAAFLDSPRYSSGYAALHNAFSFMPETHMLKPFADRVRSTHTFMHAMLEHINDKPLQIMAARQEARSTLQAGEKLGLNWALDNSRSDSILFKGYTAEYIPSKLTGGERLYYNHNKPYEKTIPFYRYYNTTTSVEIPEAYLVPQSYKQLVSLMEMHGVKVEVLDEDKVYNIEQYKIIDFKSTNTPYEGHFLHSIVEVEKYDTQVEYKKGDFLISTNQAAVQYIVHVLEPQAKDSFFAWNYFDSILQQKEHFSAYVFEDRAYELLQSDSELKKAFEDKKENDPGFAKDSNAQLDYIYHHSPHYEKTHRVYPVGRKL
jgi:hypothetical protein